MAGRGPAPAEAHTRSRNDKETVRLVSDGKKRGPILPPLVVAGKRATWHPRTKAWWESWRTSPQALRMLTGPDWEFMLETARIHHEFWSTGRWELAAELRLREGKFGATPEDRSRLRVEVGVSMPATGSPSTATRDGATTDSTNVTQIDPERRKRVADAG